MNEFLAKYQKIPVDEFPNRVIKNPVVSVCVQTYQHNNYIKDCLDGILMQKTNFAFEILLGEDESSDGTRQICIEYAEKYADKIRLFLHSRKNNIEIGGQPTGRFNMLYNLNKAKGKYIAICEGDDYWTDPLKLQKQVDFLEEKPEFVLCFHNAIILNEVKNVTKNFCTHTQNVFDIYNLIEMEWIIPTQSMIFRKNILVEEEWHKYVFGFDFALQLTLALRGKIYFIDEFMSVYRKSKGGLSVKNSPSFQVIKLIETLSFFNIFTNFEYNNAIQKRLTILSQKLYSISLMSLSIPLKIITPYYWWLNIKSIFLKIRK